MLLCNLYNILYQWKIKMLVDAVRHFVGSILSHYTTEEMYWNNIEIIYFSDNLKRRKAISNYWKPLLNMQIVK